MTIGDISGAGSVGVVCGLVLNVFYLAVRHAWPENYFGLGGSVDPIVSRNISRYVTFRFVPPFIIAAATGLTSERLGYSAVLAVLVALFVHLVRPLRDIVARVSRRQWGSVVGRTVIVSAVCITSVLALVLRDSFASMVPRPSELVANLWAGVLAAIGAVYLQGIALVKRDPGLIVRKSFEEIDEDVGRYAVSASVTRGVDPRICLALMAAENTQRPKWVRRLEEFVPAKWRTSGIMQQMGARTDRESVDLALDRYIVPWGAPELDYNGKDVLGYWLEVKALEYNADADFAALSRIALEAINEAPSIVQRFICNA